MVNLKFNSSKTVYSRKLKNVPFPRGSRVFEPAENRLLLLLHNKSAFYVLFCFFRQNSPCPILWQQTQWPFTLSRSAGAFWVHSSQAYLHLVWKTQPEGGSSGLGTSPSSISSMVFASGSGSGIESRRALV